MDVKSKWKFLFGISSSYETCHFSLSLSCNKHKWYRLTPYNCILISILTIMLNIRDILKTYSRRFNVYVETISKIDTESTCISHAKINILYFVSPSFRIRQRVFKQTAWLRESLKIKLVKIIVNLTLQLKSLA